MRRIISLVAVALVMAAMMLAMVAPAIAQGRVCAQGFHLWPILDSPISPGPGVDAFTCHPTGQPPEPPND